MSANNQEIVINDYTYVFKTYKLNGEYGGLFEDKDGNKEFKFNTIGKAQEAFEVASSTEKFSMMVIIRIDPNSNEHRETIIYHWFKSDDEEDDDEDDEEDDEEEEDQDDFTNRSCGYCPACFDLSDPHYYDEEDSCCYCNEDCFKKQMEKWA